MFQLFTNRRVLAIALIFLLLTWVMFVTSKQRVREGNVEYFLNTAMVPLEIVFNHMGSVIDDTWSTVVHLGQLKKENEKFRKENDFLKAQQLELKALKAENARLREVVKFQAETTHDMESAAVIAVNPSNWNRTVVINKGLNFGLKKNMAVITPKGVVGRIGEVRGSTAEVILMTDPRSGNFIGGRVSRTGDLVLVTGGGRNGGCTVQSALNNYFTDIRINDVLLTGETSEIFPSGIPLGRITGFHRRVNKMVVKADLTPTVKLERLDLVFVLKSKRDLPVETVPSGGK